MAIEIPAETRERQRMATDPKASVFVSANAGSGKTWVLSRRVIRLLLTDTDPGRILCLTFTKAAAAEMANRVFEVLGGWTTLGDAALAKEIEAVEGVPPPPARLKVARRLFARALETPGGLKVQTIHAFCEALLQRFPVEANLAGRFEVLDDRGAAFLIAEAKAEAVRAAALDGDGPLGRAFALLLSECPDQAIDTALRALVRDREALAAWFDRVGGLDAAVAGLPAALDVPEGATAESLIAETVQSPHFDGATLSALIPVLDSASVRMQEFAGGLRAAIGLDLPAGAKAWRELFLTQKNEPKKESFITQAVEAALPGTRARFAAEAARVRDLLAASAGLETAARTGALVRLADRMIGTYQALKARDGALDYDDLIQRTANLLARSDAAAWVQYKLDQGIDHVLVDEAQDTSPRQWDIVRALSEEFFAGAGARSRVNRTLFAVGDEKQSIYSFQGAAPKLFGENRDQFGRRIAAADLLFHNLKLVLSFRSTPDVIKAVDRVFADPAAHRGLSTDDEPTVHETVRSADAGLVEIWPETEAEKAREPEHWEDPVDRVGRGSADLLLAARIAEEVAGWLDRGERLPSTGKRIRPKDVLILVRKRGAFVEAVNRALKARIVPVAGADRLDVIGHIVTQDLTAAARVALLPEDDLTLAAVAKSPLVGLSEEDLFGLAHGREGRSLWSVAEERAAAGDAAAMRLAEAVNRWRGRADTVDPFAFFAAIVGADGGRAAFRARIGHEADEVIDEFLKLALAFEMRETPTLETFLARLKDTDEEVKREVVEGRDELRVMTVHGAKGLEAPVVFLVDPGSPPVSKAHDPRIVALASAPGAPLAWVQSGVRPSSVEAALEESRRGQEEEYRRLLYVGLTRARDRLIVTGVRRDKGSPDGRWHTLVSTALLSEAEAVKDADGAIRGWQWRADRNRAAKADEPDVAPFPPPPPLPDFLARAAPREDVAVPVTPSSALSLIETEPRRPRQNALDRVRTPDTEATLRGRVVHRLFEVLPELDRAQRREKALRYLAQEAAGLDSLERERLYAQVEGVLLDPRFEGLFGTESRAEVGLVGEIETPGGRTLQVSGQVDRLVVRDGEVMILDYKTNRAVPSEIPDDYALQLALYRRLLQDLYPSRTIRAAILWTEAVRLDEAPAERLDGMLARLVTGMGTGRGSGRS
ncbi:double-strand break repair helicase AddA [Chthonobacter albigriseus]|uniref:double-strand break repair helicase AddA n=1 Tax=Chthonobacter albigriseus TaxID=1683161 RepID=UPI0015EF801F|nr:double-strand break repair helicase AddA [Chthonobacter albigriseus]